MKNKTILKVLQEK